MRLEPFRAPPAGGTCILATYGDIQRLEPGPGSAGSAGSAASAGSGALPTAGLSPAAASSLQQQLGSAAFSAAAAPMVVLDTSRPGLPVVYHNRAFAQLLQLPPGAPAALAGRPWSLLHCADTDAAAAARLESELRAGRAAASELLCASTTGRRFWASLAAGFLHNSAGAATPYAVLAASDLTAAKSAQAAHLLRDHALSNLREGITIADPNLPDTPIIYANEAFLAMTGYSRDEVLGRNCRCAQGRAGQGRAGVRAAWRARGRRCTPGRLQLKLPGRRAPRRLACSRSACSGGGGAAAHRRPSPPLPARPRRRFLQGPETDPDAVDAIRAAVRQRRPVTVEILNYTRAGGWGAGVAAGAAAARRPALPLPLPLPLPLLLLPLGGWDALGARRLGGRACLPALWAASAPIGPQPV